MRELSVAPAGCYVRRHGREEDSGSQKLIPSFFSNSTYVFVSFFQVLIDESKVHFFPGTDLLPSSAKRKECKAQKNSPCCCCLLLSGLETDLVQVWSLLLPALLLPALLLLLLLLALIDFSQFFDCSHCEATRFSCRSLVSLRPARSARGRRAAPRAGHRRRPASHMGGNCAPPSRSQTAADAIAMKPRCVGTATHPHSHSIFVRGTAVPVYALLRSLLASTHLTCCQDEGRARVGEPENTGDCPPLSLQARRQPLVQRRPPLPPGREKVGAGWGARQPLLPGRREGTRWGAWPRGRLPAPVAAGAQAAASREEPSRVCDQLSLSTTAQSSEAACQGVVKGCFYSWQDLWRPLAMLSRFSHPLRGVLETTKMGPVPLFRVVRNCCLGHMSRFH